jgi:hypothetical protein
LPAKPATDSGDAIPPAPPQALRHTAISMRKRSYVMPVRPLLGLGHQPVHWQPSGYPSQSAARTVTTSHSKQGSKSTAALQALASPSPSAARRTPARETRHSPDQPHHTGGRGGTMSSGHRSGASANTNLNFSTTQPQPKASQGNLSQAGTGPLLGPGPRKPPRQCHRSESEHSGALKTLKTSHLKRWCSCREYDVGEGPQAGQLAVLAQGLGSMLSTLACHPHNYSATGSVPDRPGLAVRPSGCPGPRGPEAHVTAAVQLGAQIGVIAGPGIRLAVVLSAMMITLLTPVTSDLVCPSAWGIYQDISGEWHRAAHRDGGKVAPGAGRCTPRPCLPTILRCTTGAHRDD